MKRKVMAVEEDSSDNHGVAWWRGPLLSKGGFASVYLTFLKKLKSRRAFYPPLMAFNHLRDCPYILECYGEETTMSKDGKMIYNLLLEYASGGTLANLKKRSGGCGLPKLDVKRYTRSILKGINYINSHDYVHCDLKPDNVLLVPSGDGDFVPKIGDFGLAKKVQKTKKRKLDCSIAETAFYMALETLVDNIQEFPSDIWALGCMVFEMFTGKSLWRIADVYELPKIPSWISKDGKDFLNGCLVKSH
ncbi:mitogen-activated protein kinase kinase kinase 20-like [Hevea brasiliensis]|uniref:mitogen-activated protein kinase kinase kinase 20-like n=1 Tax=Hevea brasiliensis TaxID=3981 RepID=UPI0025F1DE85|nr:mitogen-activated protein kinase kinase kinase 20-like [Hevea brasiliensis]